MIRFKTKIIFRDEKTEEYDSIGFPSFVDTYVEINVDGDLYEYIPKEAIDKITVQRYWVDAS